MRRYVRRVGSINVARERVDIWIAIQTDEVPHDDVIAQGFEPVPAEMTDAEVRRRYSVDTIFTVRSSRPETSH